MCYVSHELLFGVFIIFNGHCGAFWLQFVRLTQPNNIVELFASCAGHAAFAQFAHGRAEKAVGKLNHIMCIMCFRSIKPLRMKQNGTILICLMQLQGPQRTITKLISEQVALPNEHFDHDTML